MVVPLDPHDAPEWARSSPRSADARRCEAFVDPIGDIHEEFPGYGYNRETCELLARDVTFIPMGQGISTRFVGLLAGDLIFLA